MIAIIKTGGKQYLVSEDQEINVELLDFDDKTKKILFDQVLLVSDSEGKNVKIGQPILSGAKVTASVLDTVKGDKVRIVKHHPKKHYRRQAGHRQKYLKVKIIKIEA